MPTSPPEQEPHYDQAGAPSGISDDEAKLLDESAKELTPAKNLARANEHTKFIITTVGTIGTILAGAGGVTAAVAINRTTVYWHDIPVVPLGALLTSAFAGLAVGIALWGRRPNFELGNPERLEQVKQWFEDEIGRKKAPLQWSSRMFIAAVFTAVATSVLAGVLVIATPVERPQNMVSFSTTVADKGVVTMHLGGAVDGLDEDATVVVTVTSNAPPRSKNTDVDHLIHMDVRPDAGGKAVLDAEALAQVGSTHAIATVRVNDGDQEAGSGEEWTMLASYPRVPDPVDPVNAASSER